MPEFIPSRERRLLAEDVVADLHAADGGGATVGDDTAGFGGGGAGIGVLAAWARAGHLVAVGELGLGGPEMVDDLQGLALVTCGFRLFDGRRLAAAEGVASHQTGGDDIALHGGEGRGLDLRRPGLGAADGGVCDRHGGEEMVGCRLV